MEQEAWVVAMALDELRLGKATHVTLDAGPVLLYRTDERVYAIGNRCTHQGAPLDRGPIRVGGSLSTVTCPAHGSMFRLEDGSVLRGPAHAPVHAYDVRVTSGTIELRRRTEAPSSNPVPPGPPSDTA
jgi:nitrite reductase/ring-hydroxylating ferredoxin subunit